MCESCNKHLKLCKGCNQELINLYVTKISITQTYHYGRIAGTG